MVTVLVVMMTAFAVFMVVLVMMTVTAFTVLMVMVMMVTALSVMVVMMFMLVIFVIMMMRVTANRTDVLVLKQLLGEFVLRLHSRQYLLSADFVPIGSDDSRVLVKLAYHSHRLSKFLLGELLVRDNTIVFAVSTWFL